jgi:hypothetical protein
LLETASSVILSENRQSWDLNNSTKSESTKLFIIGFSDQSIAERVLEAFRHAADLYKGKEPF